MIDGEPKEKVSPYEWYIQSQYFLYQFQISKGIVESGIQATVYAKAYELLAHADLEGLRDEVERLIQEQLNS